MKHKIFNGHRYSINKGRWRRTDTHTLLSHDVWNQNYPDDRIEIGSGFVIHHINKNTLDDRIENLQKMTSSSHASLHFSGEDNPHLGKKTSKETKLKISESVIKTKNARIKCICKYCGNEFEIIKSKLKQGGGKFCNTSCAAKYRSANNPKKRDEKGRWEKEKARLGKEESGV